MSRFVGNVAGDAYGLRNLLQIPDEEKGGLWIPSRGYGYYKRGPQAQAWQWNERQMWPNSGFMRGDASVPLAPFGMDAADNDFFGPWSLGISGHWSPYFLTGTCTDAVGNPLGGAIVQAFVTSTDGFVSQIACDDRGVYQVPCQEAVPHYLVAYYPGAPDKAGSSVNTLVPTRG